MTDVPIADPDVGLADMEAIADVLESGRLTDGETVREFEREFADYCDAERGVATCNGTAALHAALEAVGVEPGRAVITTPFSFVATANVIRLAGGIPVFADIDPQTYAIDPHSVEAILREKGEAVDAILAVHLYGLPAEMDHLRDLADTYDVALVADAAQAHGARYDGQPVGALADVGAFSFYPTKNMTTAEGGMVTTDRDDVADAVERFVNHGRDEGKYEHAELGVNYRMTDLSAAIGLQQLRRLPSYVEQRRQNAKQLTDRLAGTDVETPTEPQGRRHAYNQYTIRCADRERRQKELEREGIGTGIYYPECIHHLEAYEGFSATAPHAERASDEVLSLPVHPGVSESDIDRIAGAITGLETVHD